MVNERMNYEQWREHQRRSYGVTDEQLDRLLAAARTAWAVTGGAVGYSELMTGMMTMTSLSASECADVTKPKEAT